MEKYHTWTLIYDTVEGEEIFQVDAENLTHACNIADIPLYDYYQTDSSHQAHLTIICHKLKLYRYYRHVLYR